MDIYCYNTYIAVVVFEGEIGFDELDYQLYVAKNNPELINEFHDHNITETLDKNINNPTVQKYLRIFLPDKSTGKT